MWAVAPKEKKYVSHNRYDDLQVVWEVLHPEEALYPVCSLVGYKWF
jgi:hypothetical protein